MPPFSHEADLISHPVAQPALSDLVPFDFMFLLSLFLYEKVQDGNSPGKLLQWLKEECPPMALVDLFCWGRSWSFRKQSLAGRSAGFEGFSASFLSLSTSCAWMEM